MNDYDWSIKNKSYWYLPKETYNIDSAWTIHLENPSIYEAFKWREIHSFQSLMHYFRVTIREHTNTTREKSKTYCGTYSVIIKGAQSGLPLSIEFWDEPWKGNSRCSSYVEPFYFGRKYKDEFEYNYYQEKFGEGSWSCALGRGFEDVREAQSFAEKWKLKIIEDHKTQFQTETEIFNNLIK